MAGFLAIGLICGIGFANGISVCWDFRGNHPALACICVQLRCMAVDGDDIVVTSKNSNPAYLSSKTFLQHEAAASFWQSTS